jgi:hypothetical protein
MTSTFLVMTTSWQGALSIPTGGIGFLIASTALNFIFFGSDTSNIRATLSLLAKMSIIDRQGYFGPPALGQDTEEVLNTLLGYSQEKVNKISAKACSHRAELEKHLRKTK